MDTIATVTHLPRRITDDYIVPCPVCALPLRASVEHQSDDEYGPCYEVWIADVTEVKAGYRRSCGCYQNETDLWEYEIGLTSNYTNTREG